ncbi:hypothetical protein Dimus_004202 [Dionaea muscipula]
MNLQQKTGKDSEKVLVAVKASKEIPKTALVWALTHVVQPGDCINLLVIVPTQSSGWRFWAFPRFAGDCASGSRKSHGGTTSEQKSEIPDSCSQMILQLNNLCDPKINVKIKLAYASPCGGAVATEAKRVQANWVIMDKQLKNEEKLCMEELHCNVVVMKRSQAKVLRLNVVGFGSPSKQLQPEELAASSLLPSIMEDASMDQLFEKKVGTMNMKYVVREPVVTPSSSPELFTSTEVGTCSVSSSDPGTSSPFSLPGVNHGHRHHFHGHNTYPPKDTCTQDPIGINRNLKEEDSVGGKNSRDLVEMKSDTVSERSWLSPCSTSSEFHPWMREHYGHGSWSARGKSKTKTYSSSPMDALVEKLSKLDQEAGIGSATASFRSDVRVREEAMWLPRSPVALGPPPLCSICRHKGPVFGKPPRWFSYGELELATGGFSKANFLAEGGFGSVHRGITPDGQPIAVKQHKLASSQGDIEFCSEVEVLSCAQHRNVVMLIGYCIEDKRRLLVYEYICNGSLDAHLYGKNRYSLDWYARHKIAVGAARGLRYLHEECRVGCIVHRDMRPNNILLTHDYESLVGDFGLARWQPDGDMGVETRVIGTFGYLAPEYAQSGQITEKADVYSFGVVLLELLTGRKAVDLTRPKGQHCLSEWARPLVQKHQAIEELIDPRLGNRYEEQEVYCMMQAASLCIQREAHSRPRMSQVLRILEGDVCVDSSRMSTPAHEGRLSVQIKEDELQQHEPFSSPLWMQQSRLVGKGRG